MTTGGNSIKSKTGNAQVKKLGHTATRNHGSNPDAKVRYGGETVRDLSAK